MDIAGVTRIVGDKDTRIISVSRTVVVSSSTKVETAAAGRVVPDTVPKVETGTRIRSKILNTSNRGRTVRAKFRATISRMDRNNRMTRTRSRTRGPPTRLRTRTRSQGSSTSRMDPATLTTAATNLISIPTKRGKIITKNQDFSKSQPNNQDLQYLLCNQQMHSQLSEVEQLLNKFSMPTPCP